MQPRRATPEQAYRRDAILAAARTVFRERGYHAPLDEIAAQAGVAKGTLYLYFPSKDALALGLGLADAYFAGLTELIVLHVDDVGRPDGIAQLVRAVLAFTAQQRDVLRLLPVDLTHGSSAGTVRKHPPVRLRMQATLARAFARGMDEGVLRRYDADALASMVDGLCAWVVETCLLREAGDLEVFERTYVLLLQRALLHDPPS